MQLVVTWASWQIHEIKGCKCAGMPGMFSPPPRVIYPGMHHGTCVAHVRWYMPGSLTNGFIWSQTRGRRSRHSQRMRNTQLHASGKRSMEKKYPVNPQQYPQNGLYSQIPSSPPILMTLGRKTDTWNETTALTSGGHMILTKSIICDFVQQMSVIFAMLLSPCFIRLFHYGSTEHGGALVKVYLADNICNILVCLSFCAKHECIYARSNIRRLRWDIGLLFTM